MMSKKWQCKLLSVVLCASLIAPNLTVSAYAAEIDQGVQIGGGISESLEEDFVTDGVPEVSEPSTENAESNQPEVVETENLTGNTEGTSSGETLSEENGSTVNGREVAEDAATTPEPVNQEPVMELTSQEPGVGTVSANEPGSFSNVEVISQGFRAEVRGTFTLDTSVGKQVDILLVQYDKEQAALYSYKLNVAYEGNEVVSLGTTSVPVHEDTEYFRLEAKDIYDTELVSYSEEIPRTNKPEITFSVNEVLEGGMVEFQMSCVGDMQTGDGQEEPSFKVELVGGTTEDSDNWETLATGTNLSFVESEESSYYYARFWDLTQQQYYGKLVVYYEAWVGSDYERFFEQEIVLEPFKVTDSFGYFENVEITFGGMGLKAEYDFNYRGYQEEEDETVSIYLVQYDQNGNELYAYKNYAEYSGKHVYTYPGLIGGICAHKDAVSFRLEARGTRGKVIASESVTRDAGTIPQISYSIDDSRTNISSTEANYSIAFSGNLLHEEIFTNAIYKAVLRVGTTENEEEWKEIEATGDDGTNPHINFRYMGNVGEGFAYAKFKGLEPGNIYYGEIILTVAQSKGGNRT